MQFVPEPVLRSRCCRPTARCVCGRRVCVAAASASLLLNLFCCAVHVTVRVQQQALRVDYPYHPPRIDAELYQAAIPPLQLQRPSGDDVRDVYCATGPVHQRRLVVCIVPRESRDGCATLPAVRLTAPRIAVSSLAMRRYVCAARCAQQSHKCTQRGTVATRCFCLASHFGRG
jgi:hypothetical protein